MFTNACIKFLIVTDIINDTFSWSRWLFPMSRVLGQSSFSSASEKPQFSQKFIIYYSLEIQFNTYLIHRRNINQRVVLRFFGILTQRCFEFAVLKIVIGFSTRVAFLGFFLHCTGFILQLKYFLRNSSNPSLLD